MVENKIPHIDGAELRRVAEERLGGMPEADLLNVEDPLRLLHELQVHQIELEMQVEELRQARGELETALEKYTDLYDFAPVGYVTLDRNGTIRAANLTCSSLVCVERSQLIGWRFELLVDHKARSAFADFLEKVFTSRSKEVCESTLLKEGNSELFVQIEGVAAASGEECRIALIDISERKRAEEVLIIAKEAVDALRIADELAEALRLSKEASDKLRQAKELAEATARAKSLFFANMSHELRTPMSGILGMLQLTLEEDLSPVPREYLETTLGSARALLRILNDILDMSKIEAGKFTIEEKPFSLQGYLTEAINIMTPVVRRKGLDFVISVAEGIPDTVAGDQARQRQVLLNLIGNAIKFTEVGKVEVRVTAGRTTSDGKREITFAVSDTGIGIPDDKKDLLFQAFSQLDASHSRIYGGTGLGLAISREIVELMGGTISFESKEGVGSTFFFTIPLKETRLESESLTVIEPLEPETTTAPDGEIIPNLLIAEDDPINRKVFGLMLKRAKYNLDFAETGQKAVEMWGKGEYDLVLMDVQMPQLDGFEATRIIREKERERGGHTPIIALTAHAGNENKERCLAAGMDAFISKPIDFMACLQLIGQTIKHKSGGVN